MPRLQPGQRQERSPQRRFADLLFSDLYLAQNGSFRIRDVRSVFRPDEVPAEYHEDMRRFFAVVLARLPRRGEQSFIEVYDEARYRVSPIPALGENWVHIRKLMPLRMLNQLGFSDRTIGLLRQLGTRRGLLFLSGRPGEGKTTTACALLAEWLATHGDYAETIEDPCEIALQGEHGPGLCLQTEVQDGDFARSIHQAVRHNPRYILIGEIRSPDTASQALRAAATGALVLATIHSDETVATLAAFNKLARTIDGDFVSIALSMNLVGVLHQTLHRDTLTPSIAPFVLRADPDSPLRAHIRERSFHHLATELRSQGKGFYPTD